jgi:hypothetical protein
MANMDNLVPNEQRTPEERRENARKAGVASGEARRAKKTMRDVLEMLLEAKAPESDKTNIEAMMAKAVLKALGGDLKAMEFVRDTSGQKPDTQITVKDLKTVPYTVKDNTDGEDS